MSPAPCGDVSGRSRTLAPGRCRPLRHRPINRWQVHREGDSRCTAGCLRPAGDPMGSRGDFVQYHEYCRASGRGGLLRSNGQSGIELAALAALVEGSRVVGDPRTAVTGIAMDHRLIEKGDLFAIVPGAHFDPRRVVNEAVQAGASALVAPGYEADSQASQLVIPEDAIRLGVARLAQKIYGDPSSKMDIIGVTGTNGKTTCVYLISEILERLGSPTGTIGTLWGRLTTPEAPELAKKLAGYAADGYRFTAMEISSIALSMHRVESLRVKVAVFTNLSQDHLDFHGSMERYFEAKASLFDPVYTGTGVVNVDDEFGRRLADASRVPVRRVGLSDVELVELGSQGVRLRFRGREIFTPLVGRHNVYNLRLALEVMDLLGFSLDDVTEVIPSISAPRGRLQRVASPSGTIYVDYAHSPAALKEALSAARLAVGEGGRLVVVFGAGGERDHGKRPIMGAVAEANADAIVVTSDNPRGEDPSRIAREIILGCSDPAAVRLILDRHDAIYAAISGLGPRDSLLIAGKGHERTQSLGGQVVAFDDAEVAAAAVADVFGGRD